MPTIVRSTGRPTGSNSGACWSGRGAPASPDADERDERQVRVRPFAAAGFKSYFNERAFLRSDMSAAFDSRGLEHLSIALGFGLIILGVLSDSAHKLF